MQNKETLLQLVERLREAGQRYHDYTYINMVAGVKLCPAAPGGEAGAPCMCGANEHNKKCDAAAKALVAEIESVSDGARIIANMIPLVQKGFDFDDGDVFGILHNDAVDAIGEAELFVEKYGDKT